VPSIRLVKPGSTEDPKEKSIEQEIPKVSIGTTVGTTSNVKGSFLRCLGGAVVEFGSSGRVENLEITTNTKTVNDSAASARVQTPLVSCMWYKPSCIAWLHYKSSTTANRAVQILNGMKIDGRKVECKFQEPAHYHHGIILSVQIGNLDVFTTSATLKRRLGGNCEPIAIFFGKPSHELNEQHAESTVKQLLDSNASLESWEVSERFDPVKTRAIARFRTTEEARLAVRDLNGVKLSALGNSKVFASLIVSVKFSMLTTMCHAIKDELDEFERQSWETHRVQFKAYLPAPDIQQVTTVLRLYGEDSKSVAQAKRSLEAILAGSVAVKNGIPIWDTIFTKLDGLAFLKSIIHVHGGFVYRDLRMSRLRVYGDLTQKGALQLRLTEKVDELNHLTHTLILAPTTLRHALSGGFRRIVEVFGKQAATLNIACQPKSITIHGSRHDFERACGILMQEEGSAASSNRDNAEDCVVCWTEATDSLRTTCKHTYCSDCFAGQCSSASDGNIPVRCLGSAGDCTHIFSIPELEDLLKPDEFEQFFEKAFAVHIRTHKEVQYCPTPDCPNVYRVTSDGTIFTCASCLTAICTTCQAVSHEGVTCEQYRDLRYEGMKAFHQWKVENGVKDCPACEMAIEKTYGCNHMECMACGIHICWTCMQTFNTGPETYGHMERIHGSF